MRRRRRWLILGAVALGACILAIGYSEWQRRRVPSKAIQAERDRLVVEADREIRAGLAELALRYPQVQEAMADLARFDEDIRRSRIAHPAEHPSIVIAMGRPPGIKRIASDGPEKFEASRFGIHIQLAAHRSWPPERTGRPFGTQHVFPNLHLGSYAGMFYAAVDPQLDREIKQVIDNALAPLAALDVNAGSRQPLPWGTPNAYPSQQK